MLYLQLLQALRPATVIELGVYDGGSTLWFADMMRVHDIEPRVVGVDINLPAGIEDAAITLLSGDVRDLEHVLSAEFTASLPHPWLVIEDSAHFYETTLAALDFFDSRLQTGDYIVIEDGIISAFEEEAYRVYEDGPNRALRDFLARADHRYDIDTSLCDYFGRNVTYNPNGWLRRL